MNEDIPANEGGSEKIPNEREVLNLFEEIIDGDFEIYRSLEDEHGLYMFEVRGTDSDGDILQYNYIRAGAYPEGSSSSTVVDVIYFMGDIPCGGDCVARYENGQWVKLLDTTPVESVTEAADLEIIGRETLEAQYEEIRLLERENWNEFESARATVVSELGYEVVNNQGKWLTLIKNGHTITLKHFEEGSEYGYEAGKISMFLIHKGESRGLFKSEYTGEEVLLFDKGYTEQSSDPAQKELFDELVAVLN